MKYSCILSVKHLLPNHHTGVWLAAHVSRSHGLLVELPAFRPQPWPTKLETPGMGHKNLHLNGQIILCTLNLRPSVIGCLASEDRNCLLTSISAPFGTEHAQESPYWRLGSRVGMGCRQWCSQSVCVWKRERDCNTIWILLGSGTDLERCSPEVMGCFNHQSYNLLLTRGGTPGGWDPGKVRARMPLLGFPFSLGQSLMEWADKTVLCRCPLLLWLPSEEAESPHYTSPLWTQIDFCWINKGTALWQFIVCNELLK